LVTLVGGGGLVMSALVAIRESGLPLPAAGNHHDLKPPQNSRAGKAGKARQARTA